MFTSGEKLILTLETNFSVKFFFLKSGLTSVYDLILKCSGVGILQNENHSESTVITSEWLLAFGLGSDLKTIRN